MPRHEVSAGAMPLRYNWGHALTPHTSTRQETGIAMLLRTPCLVMLLLALGVGSSIATSTFAQSETKLVAKAEMSLWPGTPPGTVTATGEEADTSTPESNQVAGRYVTRLGNVSKPMITVYSPPEDRNTGAAVLVCPGGGYHILAYDLEGTEVCEWLNSIGVTGVLLKYRVPKPAGVTGPPVEALQDAQRAMSLIRQNAEQWSIDPERVGVLGFSAGGSLSARLSTNYNTRAYEKVDAADDLSRRPNFALLIYPAYLVQKQKPTEIDSELIIDENTPPMFMTMAWDDPVDPRNILQFGIALKNANVPSAVHLFPQGGHGYGLRRTEQPATAWPDLATEWMKASGWLE